MIEIRWHGRGGQGAFTASKIFGGAAVIGGKEKKYFALAFPSFGPERRGAPIQAFTKIDRKPVTNRSTIKKCDYIVILDETLYQKSMLDDLKENGKIIINTSKPEQFQEFDAIIAVDGTKIAMDILHMPVVNTVMLGFLAGLSGIVTKDDVCAVLKDYLPEKIAKKNELVIEKVQEVLKDYFVRIDKEAERVVV